MTRTVCGRMPHLRKPCALFALPMALCIALVCSVHAGEVRWTGGAGVGEDGLYDWTLGWKPHENFDTGIRRTVQWYLDNEWWWKPIHEKRYSGQRLGKG